MDREDMDKALTMFYEQMGWDTETGIPTRATLEKFGLSDMGGQARGIRHPSRLISVNIAIPAGLSCGNLLYCRKSPLPRF